MTEARSTTVDPRALAGPLLEGLFTGALAAVFAAIPAALRVAHGGIAWASAWLALAGSAALVLGPLSAALRVARPLPRWAVGIPIGVVLASAPLILFAKLLKSATHYRPLGAVTFAILGGGVVIGGVTVALRLLSAARSAESSLGRTLCRAALIVLTLGCLGLALRWAAPALGGRLGHGVFDGTVALGLVAASVVVPVPRRLRYVGGLAWLGLVLAGTLTLRAAPALAARAHARAPVLLGPCDWLGGTQ